MADPADVLAPEPASDEDILRVHTPEWVSKLKNDTLSATERMRLEIPCSKETVEAFWLAAGGSILAAQHAMRDGFGVNIGGGFHHAFPGHGEGFCMIHDVAVAIRRIQADGAIRTAMVVDTDVHQGNGTAAIFAEDDSVFTLSIHQRDNYPVPKQPSDLDINLEDCTGDDEYLELLGQAVLKALAGVHRGPDLLCGRRRPVPRRSAWRVVAQHGRAAAAGRISVSRGEAARHTGGGDASWRVRAEHRGHRADPYEYGAGGAGCCRWGWRLTLRDARGYWKSIRTSTVPEVSSTRRKWPSWV